MAADMTGAAPFGYTHVGHEWTIALKKASAVSRYFRDEFDGVTGIAKIPTIGKSSRHYPIL